MTVLGFDEFELDLELAFKRDLPPFIDSLASAPLTNNNVMSIPFKKNGVYLLIQNNSVLYVGKTDSKAGFQNRLIRHAYHIRHRINLDTDSIFFKAVAIPVFKNADLEGMLIEHYHASWNYSGFGGNDPGRQRDTQKPADFDINYPIDVDKLLDFIPLGPINLIPLLKILSSNLPYTFRYEKQAHQDELNIMLIIPDAFMTMRMLLGKIIEALPEQWQATILLGRVILYRENRSYLYSQEIIRLHHYPQ